MVRGSLSRAVLLLLGLFLLPVTSANATPAPSKAGEVILKFKPGASQSAKDAILSALHANRLKHFSRINADHERITGMTVDQAISRFRGDPALEYIEPNYIVSAVSIPNDPSFGLLWGMRNTAQFGGTPGADIHAVDAWDLTTGSTDVIVAIIDTGVDYNHPDLAANIYTNPGEIPGNGIDDDNNGFVDDVRGWDFVNHDNDPFDDFFHGTHVAGTVGAVGDNGVGVVGVCWHVRLMPLKFLSSSGSGTTADAISAIEYATLMHVRIMSNSWGGGGYSDALRDAISAANDAGILFVAAAGNAGLDTDLNPFYPADYDLPNVISVAATTPSDDKASFSNYGLTSVDLGAPGTQTLSTIPGGGYTYLQGTSMATPHVSGALALMYSRFPLMSAAGAKALLLNSTDHVPSLNGLVATGGRLNVARALQGPDSIPPAPVADLGGTGTGSNRVTLGWTASGDDGHTGTAAAYDIRYDRFPISEASFASASPATGAPAPMPSGAHQTLVVGGLDPSTTYYFAMKVRDEFGNTSDLSNNATATTLIAPDIDVSPAALSASLVSGETAPRSVTIRNLTAGTLDYEIVSTPTGSGGSGAAAAPSPITLTWRDYAQAAGAAADTTAHPISTATAAADLTPVIVDPPDDGGLVDLSRLLASANHDSITIQLEFSTALDRINFGGFLSLDTDQNTATGVAPAFGNGAQSIGAEYEIQLFSLGSGVVYVYNAPTRAFITSVPALTGPHFVRFSIPLSALGNDDGSMNISGVIGDDLGPTDWFPDAGHGTIAGIRWLTASPNAGTVPPGGTLNVNVTFDAGGLQAGSYDGSLRILSNDPDEPVTTVTGHLDVSGTPAISLSSTVLDYGPVLFGASRTDSIVVRNVGTGTLHITDLFSDNPAFVVGTAPFNLDAGQTRSVLVTFTPSGLTTFDGSLFILSDDPVDGELFAVLSGRGVTAPNISISPSSLTVSIPSGRVETRTVAVSNTGSGNLAAQVSVQGAITALAGVPYPAPAYAGGESSTASSDATAIAEQAGSVAPASVLVIQDSGAWGLGMSLFLQSRFGITPTVISSFSIDAVDFSAFDLIITMGDQNSAYYDNLSIHQTKFESFVSAGGVVQYQVATLGTEVRLVGGARSRFGFLELQNQAVLRSHPIVSGLPWILEGNFANNNYLTNLPAGTSVITETAISRVPTTVEYAYGSGKVIATGMTWEYLYVFGFPAAPMLTQATQYSLSQVKPRWLRVSPASLTVAPGGSQNVQVSFDSNHIPAGGYDAAVRLVSNDPDQGVLLAPAHLDVIPSPDIALSAMALVYGSLFRGAAKVDSIVVSNSGTDPLQVTGVVSTAPDFTASPGTFTVNPGQHRGVVVTFHPSVTGLIQGTLFIRSNDPDEPELSVALSGTGIEPPVIALTPDSFTSSLLVGQSETRTLRIANQGLSNLEFSLTPRFRVSGAAADTTSSAAAPLPTTPTGNAANPSSGPIEVASMYSGTFLSFGISELGEIMPFQYPLGREHLQIGAFVSGYLVAYIDGGGDHVCYAGYQARNGIIPVSIQELENTPQRVVVKVVSRTSDGRIEIRRVFTFLRSGKSIVAETRVVNVSGVPLTNVVFKEFADWDVDGTPGDDTWGYDRSRNMIYAADSRYLAVAASESPTLMDLYGWDDYTVRPTHVQYPTGPITPLDGLEVLHFDRGTLNPSQVSQVTCVYAAGDNLVELQGVVDRSLAPPWLTLSPPTGTVAPGSSVDIAVGVSAADLVGGDYAAQILTDSNDPIRPEVSTPVDLHVTGVPAIQVDPLTLDFGTLFVGLSASRGITVRNPGTDLLNVTVTSGDPRYSAVPSTFTVAARDSQPVVVTFTPGSVGDFPASLVLNHNAGTPPVTVALTGRGAPAPDIDVSPTSLSSSLLSGASETQTLAVRNTGGSDLTLTVGVGSSFVGSANNPTPRARDGSNSMTNAAAQGVQTQAIGSTAGVLLIEDTDSWGLDMGAFLASRFGITPTVIHSDQIASTDFSPYALIITVGAQSTSYYAAVSANRSKFESYVSDGGIVQYQLANFGSDVSIAGGPMVRFGSLELQNRVLLPFHPIVAGLPTVLDGDYASHGFLTQLPAGAQVITETYLSHLPTTVEYPLGAGKVIATGMTWEFLYDFGFAAGAMLPQATAYSLSLARPPWLEASPTAATVPPGGSVDLTVTFRAAGLNGGEYSSAIVIASNDPDESRVRVPAHLTVTGVPDIALSATSVAFGSLFAGLSRQDSIVVSNPGTDRLDVTEITSSPAAFTHDAAPFSLVPGQSRVIHLTFHPGSVGSFSGALLLRSNDPDEGAVSVALSGVGLAPPVMVLSPASIHADVPLSMSQTKTVTLRNDGGSELTFTAVPRVTAPAVAIQPSVSLAKGETDPRVGPPVAQGAGGPDHFGYVWTDSDEPQGPPFGWIDIGTTGTVVPISGDDQTSGPIPLAFAFPFYGNFFSSFHVCTNGFLSFTNPSAPYTNQPLPTPGAPENMIAAFWDDLYVNPGTSVVLAHSDANRAVIEFKDVYLLDGEGPYTFEIVLFPMGTFLVQYLSIGGPTGRETVGFQNGTADDGLTIAFNTPYVHDNLAIRCAAVPPWLTVSPLSGSVAPGSSLPLSATIQTAGLDPGDYAASIRVQGNDPVTPAASVPVTLRVLGLVQAAATQVDPNTLNRLSNGKLIQAYVELPAGLDPNGVVLSTVRFQSTLPPTQDALVIGDFNANGIPDLQFRFDRSAVEQMLAEGDVVPVVVTGGILSTALFVARDSIRVIRPKLHAPNGGEQLAPGSSQSISWVNPQGWTVDYYDLYYSTDDGASWIPFADRVTEDTFSWAVPPTPTTLGRVRVYAYDSRGIMGYDSSDQVFTITSNVTGVDTQPLPLVHALYQNDPNPFNPRTTIRYDLPAASRVRLAIYGVDGRLVRTVVDQFMPAGRHAVTWDGKDDTGQDVGTSVYFYRMSAGRFEASRKLILLK